MEVRLDVDRRDGTVDPGQLKHVAAEHADPGDVDELAYPQLLSPVRGGLHDQLRIGVEHVNRAAVAQLGVGAGEPQGQLPAAESVGDGGQHAGDRGHRDAALV